MSVCCVLCVVRCDELITCPEDPYRLWCVVVCDQETSRMRRPWPAWGRSATEKNGTVNCAACEVTLKKESCSTQETSDVRQEGAAVA
jgi:hypothetical protein